MEIWIATENAHKKQEFVEIFGPYHAAIKTVSDLDSFVLPPETGKTFAENALIKARALYQEIGAPVIADDSGLAVEVLDGAPGIYSARYSGEGATDESNRELLLERMRNQEERTAAFICVIAFIDETGAEFVFEGRLTGTILDAEQGQNGFGYDPIFYTELYQKSLAELTPDEKNAISHRGQALEQLQKHPAFLKQMTKEGLK